MTARRLGTEDGAVLQAFLAEHQESSLFLLHNLLRGGLEYRGQRHQGEYLGVFRDQSLVGVVCHTWRGTLLVQAPDREAREQLEALIPRLFSRRIIGLIGPRVQCLEMLERLGLERSMAYLDQDEPLYRLELRDLRLPERLAAPGIGLRPPRALELDALIDWRIRYQEEVLFSPPSTALRRNARDDLEAALEEARAFVLTLEDVPVAYCNFNAITPHTVQVGGLWVPPEQRGHHFGRAVLAGALEHARTHGGVRLAVVLIDDGNRPALAGCEALGFERSGRFSFTLWAG